MIGHQGYNFHQGSAPRLQTFLGEHQGYNIHQGVAPRLQTFLVGHQGYNFHQGVAPRLPTWHQGYKFHQGVAPRSVSPKSWPVKTLFSVIQICHTMPKGAQRLLQR